MDLKTLLSKSFQEQKCECGMKHSCPVEDVIIGEGAVEKAAALLSEHKNVLIVSDANTRPLAFDRLSGAVCHVQLWAQQVCGQYPTGASTRRARC